MKVRSTIGKVLLVLVLPVVFLGLIDPLEGGLALIAATAIYAVAFVLLKAAPSKLLWIPFLATLVIGGATIIWAIFGRDQQEFGPIPPPVIVALWLYRAAVVMALLGGLFTAYKHIFGLGTKN